MNSVSIVIPNYLTQPLMKNLPKIIQAAAGAEIIVVDDASPDGAGKTLAAQYPQIKVIVNQFNQRFAAACNRGVKAAKGEIVMLLNSDVIPKPGFLKPLITHFNDKNVFAVSCLEIDNAGKFSGRNQYWWQRGFIVHSAAPVKAGETGWATGGSSAFDRKKYLSLGGMDRLFYPAYWEDIDLSYRARLKGWRILFEPKSQVYHDHETTNAAVFGIKAMTVMAFRNQILFVWKNIRGLKLFLHFLWLPYHLTVTTLKTKGIFLMALFQAIIRKIFWRDLSKL